MRSSVRWAKVALTIIIALSIAVCGFHLVVMAGAVPMQYVWGGRLQSREELLVMESVSLLINLMMVGLCLWERSLIKKGKKQLIISVLFGLLALMFALNTLGNLVAEQTLETMVFTPLTLVSSVLCAVVALRRKGE